MPLRDVIKKWGKESWMKELEKLAGKYATLSEKELKLRGKYPKLFRKLDQINDDKDAVKIAIQNIARKQASVGETRVLVNDDRMFIDVCGPQSSPRYDMRLARKYWPKDLLKEVMVIDHQLVKEMAENGVISDKLLKKAMMDREALSPRVTVKVKNV